MTVVQIVVWVLAVYCLTGLGAAGWYLRRAVSQADESAAGASWQTKALWLPGLIVLWPWLLRRLKKPAVPGGPNPAPARHRAIWMALAIVLPALFVLAVLSIPRNVASAPPPESAGADFPMLLEQKTAGSLLFSLRSSGEKRQLKIEASAPLEAPSAVVRVNGKVLGIISSRGIYRFETDSARLQHVQLFDAVRQQVIAETSFLNN